MSMIPILRHEIALLPESARVIIRPFIPSETHRINSIISRALALKEGEVRSELDAVRSEFDQRHFDIDAVLRTHFAKVSRHVLTLRPLSPERELLIGALFSGEYALESAAIFNPSIVPHPDQTGVPEGGLRFIMSLRATGEGHISSIEFRSGIIQPDNRIILDPVSRFVTVPEIIPNPVYNKDRFIIKLAEMGFEEGRDNGERGLSHATTVMAPLGDCFTRSELNASVASVSQRSRPSTRKLNGLLECIQWLADYNQQSAAKSLLPVLETV
jgi:hypothetical protein